MFFYDQVDMCYPKQTIAMFTWTLKHVIPLLKIKTAKEHTQHFQQIPGICSTLLESAKKFIVKVQRKSLVIVIHRCSACPAHKVQSL